MKTKNFKFSKKEAQKQIEKAISFPSAFTF